MVSGEILNFTHGKWRMTIIYLFTKVYLAERHAYGRNILMKTIWVCKHIKIEIVELFLFILPFNLFYQKKLDQRLWPRACAVAERLWSNPSTPSVKAGDRLNQHRKRLQSLGIKPEPLQPEYCSLNEGECL